MLKDKVAIVTDIRGGDMFYQLDGGLEYLRHSGPDVKILFLDASDDVLIKRYKETLTIYFFVKQIIKIFILQNNN